MTSSHPISNVLLCGTVWDPSHVAVLVKMANDIMYTTLPIGTFMGNAMNAEYNEV